MYEIHIMNVIMKDIVLQCTWYPPHKPDEGARALQAMASTLADACAAIPRQGRTHGRRVGGDFGRACYGASAAAKTRHKSSSFRLAALHHLCNEADITATALITRELTGSGRSPQDPEKSVEVLIWRCQGLCRRTPRSRVGLSGSRPALSVVEAANHLLEEGARSGSRVGGIRLES